MTQKWLNTTRSNVPHRCVISIHKSQIWLHFALYVLSTIAKFHSVCSMTSHFRDTILRQVQWMTLKWPWTPQGQMYPICITSVLESQISVHFPYRQPFWNFWHFFSYRSFWKKCTEFNFKKYHSWPQSDLVRTIQGQIVLLESTSLKFHSVSFYNQPFSRLQAILRKLHQMNPKRPWTPQG